MWRWQPVWRYSQAHDHGDGVHTHLCPYITIILRGGYWETIKTGKHPLWRDMYAKNQYFEVFASFWAHRKKMNIIIRTFLRQSDS